MYLNFIIKRIIFLIINLIIYLLLISIINFFFKITFTFFNKRIKNKVFLII